METLQLWLITGCNIKNKRALDYYDSAVVAAYTAEQAKDIHPNGTVWGSANIWHESCWCKPKDVEADLLGDAAVGIKYGEVICASFNAG